MVYTPAPVVLLATGHIKGGASKIIQPPAGHTCVALNNTPSASTTRKAVFAGGALADTPHPQGAQNQVIEWRVVSVTAASIA